MLSLLATTTRKTGTVFIYLFILTEIVDFVHLKNSPWTSGAFAVFLFLSFESITVDFKLGRSDAFEDE